MSRPPDPPTTFGILVDRFNQLVHLTVEVGDEGAEIARVSVSPDDARAIARRLLLAADAIDERERE